MNTQPAHLLLAGATSIAYVVLCFTVWSNLRAQRRVRATLMLAQDDAGPRLLIAHASQTGTAEALAIQTAGALQTAGVNASPCPLAQLDAEKLLAASELLFIVSTYGEGDPPDAAAHFVAAVMGGPALALSGVRYGLLMLGDRSYRNFCGFGHELDTWLREHGAQPLFDPIEADNCNALALQAWRRELGHIAATTDLPEWQDVPFEPWTLRARQHLNPGSAGGPVFHLELVRARGLTEGWEAGDLLQIMVPADPARPRDYSIASIPDDGAVHLLIRLEEHADGSTGLASGWLTRNLEPGTTVQARLRVHGNFRIGDNTGRDLILIGNGTGLAGLRSHLKQRAMRPAAGSSGPRHWLIYGERQAAHDALYSGELAAWHASGLLTHLDLVYSRDGDAHRYVQERLAAESNRLRQWVQEGAAIYVCGSLEGMAEGVAQVLREALGEATLFHLQEQGRYRRDVY